MRHSTPTGTAFTATSPDQIDDWSREVFKALSDWAQAHDGRWLRYDPGYLLLEIDTFDGKEIDPILVDTADEEVTVGFGYWEMHLPDQACDGDGAAREAVDLVSQWLSGQIRTAVFTDENGNWCGTMLVEQSGPFPPRPSDGMAYFKPIRVEVRSPDRSAWQTFDLAS